MVKQYMLGYVVNLHPGRRSFGVKIHMFLFNPVMVGDNIFMAVQTFFHRRQSRMIRIVNIGMAKSALDLLYAAVHRVAERNRLFRSDPGGRRGVIKIQKSRDENQTANGQQNGGDVLSQCSGYLM